MDIVSKLNNLVYFELKSGKIIFCQNSFWKYYNCETKLEIWAIHLKIEVKFNGDVLRFFTIAFKKLKTVMEL